MFKIGDIVIRIDGNKMIMKGSVPRETIFYVGYFLVIGIRIGTYKNNLFKLCKIMDSKGNITWSHQALFKLICRYDNGKN